MIVRELGEFNGVLSENDDLMNIVTKSRSQEISNDSFIPRSYFDLALKRIEWYAKKKNDRNFEHKQYDFLFNQDIIKFDVIAFYLLCQAIGVKYGPNSRESRVLVESQGKLIENRLSKLSKTERNLIVTNILNSLLSSTHLKWTFFEDLISSKKLKMHELILDKGEIILEMDDFLERFSYKIHGRKPEKMYEALIGDRIKEQVMIKMVMQNTENYIQQVGERSHREIEPNPILLELADKISEVLISSVQTFGKGGSSYGISIKASALNPKSFPPCVKKVMEGMKSGGRNDAIIMFLTPFISYARLYPSVFSENITKQISDVDPTLSIIQNEILPLIFGAAERCNPPLFEDQPQDKVNLNAKLGFGMHQHPELKNEGETTWYTPMSCEKVKIHLPSLCKPDETCKKIGNPLSYYNRKLWAFKKEMKNISNNKDK
ncbi:MAG: DNA primase [Methanobacterium sp.]|nr:DNA primase [Methanobacterium sp.]